MRCCQPLLTATWLLASLTMAWVGNASLTQAATLQDQTGQAVAASEPLRILNWNVLYAFNHGKSVDAGVQWIRACSPDVVALQELNGLTEASLKTLASRWGHDHSVILKEKGFPVGLTSRQPIDLIERQVEGFHHGYLHARTLGIHFFVVHFWPGKDHEARAVAAKIRPLLQQGGQVVLLGDFNNHSRRDHDFLVARDKVEPRYEVVDLFESIGLVDLVQAHQPGQKYSCPSPITIPRWSADLAEVKSKRQRIDFIFADERLAKSVRGAEIRVSDRLDKISDHYPVVVEIRLPPEMP